MNTIPMVTPATEPRQPLTPMAMIERALEIGASPDALEKLMNLQERWQGAEAKRAFGESMVSAQAVMRPISADASNPQTRSKYASYHGLDRVLRPIYSAHGFSVSFDTGPTEEPTSIMVIAYVTHKDGHMQPFQIPMPADGKGAKGGDVMTKTHATGAAITYGRRYLLGMIFNIAVGEDYDGNVPSSDNETLTAEQFRLINELLEKTNSDEGAMLAFVRASDLESMSQSQAKKAIAAMQHKLKTKAAKP